MQRAAEHTNLSKLWTNLSLAFEGCRKVEAPIFVDGRDRPSWSVAVGFAAGPALGQG